VLSSVALSSKGTRPLTFQNAWLKALLEKEAQLTKREENMSQLEEEVRERAALHAKQDIADAAALRRGHDQKVTLPLTLNPKPETRNPKP
jgi:hypothetical protein